ncbi:hypothetical protein H6G65_02595 [Microcystis elabens FACHB-917]|nr:hypothetical protein [Microcystis elabens FACHB-917]
MVATTALVPVTPASALTLTEANLTYGNLQSFIVDTTWTAILLTIENGGPFEPNSSQDYSGLHSLTQENSGDFSGNFSGVLQGSYRGELSTINYSGNALFPFDAILDPDVTITELTGKWADRWGVPDEYKGKGFGLPKDNDGKVIPGKLTIDDITGKGKIDISISTDGQTSPQNVKGDIAAKKDKDGKVTYTADDIEVTLPDGSKKSVKLTASVDKEGNLTSSVTRFGAEAASNKGSVGPCNSPCPTRLTYTTTAAPGPLPILGLGAVFCYSRKLRKIIKSSKPELIRTTAV